MLYTLAKIYVSIVVGRSTLCRLAYELQIGRLFKDGKTDHCQDDGFLSLTPQVK